MFDLIIEKFYLVPISTLLLFIFMSVLNNWDITPIEKKLITRFKRFQIEFSMILFETLITGIYFAIVFVLNKEMLKSLAEINDIYLKILLISITIFCIVFPIVCIVHLVILLSKWLIIPKRDYYITMDSPKGKWFVKRKTIDNQILLKNSENVVLLINEWENLEFKSCNPRNTKLGNLIFKTKKRCNSILLYLFISMVSLITIQFFLKLERMDLIITTVILVTLFTIFYVILYSKKYYYSGSNNN